MTPLRNPSINRTSKRHRMHGASRHGSARLKVAKFLGASHGHIRVRGSELQASFGMFPELLPEVEKVSGPSRSGNI